MHLGGARKLGHVNCLTADIQAGVRFYTEVLGMGVSDWLGEAGVWFHVNSDHHVMALVDLGYAHFHHLAFETVDIGKMRDMLDHVARHGRWLGWGPARHGIAGNIASYVRIVEEECFVELYCDMEQLQDDHVPRVYPDDRYSSNTWGPLPPRSYFRFDPVAIEYERESLETRGHVLPPLPRDGLVMPLTRLHDPALARRALLARPVPAVALRRRLPRRRVLGRSGEGRLVPARRHGSAPRSGPLRVRLRRLAVVLVEPAASCSIPRARSTRRRSSSSTRCSTARR